MIIPSGYVHGVVGLIIGGFLFSTLFLPFVWAGALIADCDTRFSLAGKILPVWMLGIRHRSRVTHSLWALMLWPLPLLDFNWHIWLAFTVGYASHLLLDSRTPMGIKWL